MNGHPISRPKSNPNTLQASKLPITLLRGQEKHGYFYQVGLKLGLQNVAAAQEGKNEAGKIKLLSEITDQVAAKIIQDLSYTTKRSY